MWWGNLPGRKSSPRQERERSLSNRLLQPLGHCTNVLFWFHPTQTHKAEMYKDGEEQEEKQGLLTAATWWESLQFIMTYSGDKLSRFHHWLNKDLASHLAFPSDDTRFCASGIYICSCGYWSPFPVCPQTPARVQSPESPHPKPALFFFFFLKLCECKMQA